MCHLYDLVLAPTGLKLTQFIMLYVIGEAGEIAHCELARHFVASEETFSRRLASARRAGWVEMKRGERNRRVYCLTDRGLALLESAKPYWKRAQERIRRELGELDWDTLSAFADRVTQAALRAEQARSTNGPSRSTAPPSPSDSGIIRTDLSASL